MFPTILSTQNTLATFVLFMLAGASWTLGARIVSAIEARTSK